jgi:exodeoxyribonuclease V alpha subunit
MTESIQLTSLDQHFADFINSLDSHLCDELWLAAALASNAAGRGHTCLNLPSAAEREVMPFTSSHNPMRTPPAEKWLNTLYRCDTVGKPGDYAPLVLDNAGRLYLHRSWDYERRTAEGILTRSVAVDMDAERLAIILDRYFPARDDGFDQQREAARAAMTRRFAVISGGPGTGKTATVARILALMIECAQGQELRIALATPTGKAAMRLKQSILDAILQLPLAEDIRTALPTEVSTIHRLLGVIPGTTSFRHNRNNRLACNVLVIDEASMVDLPLMARLLEALPDDARVILLGDRDQLASVEAGAVLADICLGAPSQLSPLPLREGTGEGKPAVIQLTKSYRFGQESGIGRLSRLINAGDSSAAMDLLKTGTQADLVWRQLPPGNLFGEEFTAAVTEGYGNYLGSTTPDEALDALERFRVLSPLREGAWGIENLNRICETTLGLRGREGTSEYRLKSIMVTGNNYELGLFNGDTGVLMEDPAVGRLAAWFSVTDKELRRLSPLRLPPHETAFALTVHKSQGSEFDRVLLVLPERVSEVLCRELLYTAVTRARVQVEIWGTEEVFRNAVERHIERSSGLSERLWG